jgi:hypothetical protein
MTQEGKKVCYLHPKRPSTTTKQLRKPSLCLYLLCGVNWSCLCAQVNWIRATEFGIGTTPEAIYAYGTTRFGVGNVPTLSIESRLDLDRL